jgi:hypothetical protein
MLQYIFGWFVCARKCVVESMIATTLLRGYLQTLLKLSYCTFVIRCISKDIRAKVLATFKAAFPVIVSNLWYLQTKGDANFCDLTLCRLPVVRGLDETTPSCTAKSTVSSYSWHFSLSNCRINVWHSPTASIKSHEMLSNIDVIGS